MCRRQFDTHTKSEGQSYISNGGLGLVAVWSLSQAAVVNADEKSGDTNVTIHELKTFFEQKVIGRRREPKTEMLLAYDNGRHAGPAHGSHRVETSLSHLRCVIRSHQQGRQPAIPTYVVYSEFSRTYSCVRSLVQKRTDSVPDIGPPDRMSRR